MSTFNPSFIPEVIGITLAMVQAKHQNNVAVTLCPLSKWHNHPESHEQTLGSCDLPRQTYEHQTPNSLLELLQINISFIDQKILLQLTSNLEDGWLLISSLTDQECLYKYISSKYNDQSGVPTPKAPTPLLLSGTGLISTPPSPFPVPRRAEIPDFHRKVKVFRPLGSCCSRPSSSAPRPKFSAAPMRSAGNIDLHIEGRCATQASPTPKPHITKPGTWATKVLSPEPPQEPKIERALSACSARPRPTPPPRPVKSADAHVRSPPVKEAPVVVIHAEEEVQEEPVDEVKEEDVQLSEDDTESLGVDDPLDYDQQLRMHGWRMEVPGDPLHLKWVTTFPFHHMTTFWFLFILITPARRKCIAKRGKYSVTIPSTVIPPDPPKVHMETSEPFFSNTIPRRPLTFTIHQDWSSEVLLAKRLELQKRDGDRYKYRQNYFSFVYWGFEAVYYTPLGFFTSREQSHWQSITKHPFTLPFSANGRRQHPFLLLTTESLQSFLMATDYLRAASYLFGLQLHILYSIFYNIVPSIRECSHTCM